MVEMELGELIKEAEKLGVIQQTVRNFSLKKKEVFISLKLEVVSLEAISWILASLRKNEMIPTEKAIQSRIKEAFALKVPIKIWDLLISQVSTQDRFISLRISDSQLDHAIAL
jgi:hypothetical protein